jgi:hypothetical protein
LTQKLKITLVALAFTASIFIPFTRLKAQETGWLSVDEPTVEPSGQINGGDSLPDTVTGYGNIDCSEHTFITRPEKFLSLQSEVSHTACAVETDFGFVDPAGYIQLNGTRVAGKVKQGSSHVTLLPIPDSDSLAHFVYTSSGFKVIFYRNINHLSFTVDKQLNGEVSYVLPSNFEYLRDEAGNHLYVRPDTVSLSRNGDWMIVDSQYVATLRVNLADLSVVPFSSPQNYHNGANPQLQSAVSNDGRYAVLSTKVGAFEIHDFSTCAEVPSNISGPVTCQRKSLQPAISVQEDGYRRVSQPRFITPDLLRLYAIYKPAAVESAIVKKYRLAPAGTAIINSDYLALGDSYASGEGTWGYYPHTDTDQNGCKLSPKSYPYLIGQSLELDEYNSVACAGAKIDNITTHKQADGEDPVGGGGLGPGYKSQIEYVDQQNPNVLTIGISGNDIGFSSILIKCIQPGTCYDSYEERKELLTTIKQKFTQLESMFQLAKNTAKESTVYAIGYPRLAKNNGNCAVNVPLNRREIRFSNQVINYLNGVIKAAAEKSGVYYVDVSNAFRGHKLCETASERVAVHGATAGRDTPSELPIFSGESFHPKKLGHRLFKKKILRKTNYFQAEMPEPINNTQAPPITDDMPILRNYVQQTELDNSQIGDLIDESLVVRGESASLYIDGDRFSLRANSRVSIELRSEEINLGEYETNEDGSLNQTVTIPENTLPGFHTLHVYGENIAGESIDIHQTIYVAHDHDNYDGDAFINSIDRCPIINVIINGESKNKRCHYRN